MWFNGRKSDFLGVGASISVVNVEASVDFYQLSLAAVNLYKAGEEYVKETVQKMKNVKEQIPDSNKKNNQL